MEREIKFRAWDDRQWQQMHPAEDLAIRLDDGHVMFFDTDAGGKGVHAFVDAEYSKDFILMQYTGLKDKNGKDIYPKDILKNQHGIIYLIEDWFEDSDSLSAIQNGIMIVEIIGNIYENPELLDNK